MADPHPPKGQRVLTQTAALVLKIEAEAVMYMADNLPPDFQPAADAILKSTGRVMVSGIGKSGHIARKIAATFSSTGTPAYFVHAAESSHGDMGMITGQDVCILISNSGETREMSDIIHYTSRFNIPLIAISSNPDSTLMQAADYKLTLPQMPEACSIGKAPTTSTTLTLALGDALAVALMEQRNFDATQFQVFHPGGKLGAELRTVAQLMHGAEHLPLVTSDTTMSAVLDVMNAKGFGLVVVADGGRVQGVISDGDLRRNMDGLMEKSAGDLMGGTPITVTPETLAGSALATLNANKVSALVVTSEDMAPLGILNVHDFLRAAVV